MCVFVCIAWQGDAGYADAVECVEALAKVRGFALEILHASV